jgi:hypothetical protein
MDRFGKIVDILLFQNNFSSGIETTLSTKWCINTRDLLNIGGKISDFYVSVK